MLSLEQRLSIDFGLPGNDQPYLRDGWADPEVGFRWSLGERSRLCIPAPSTPGDYALLLTITPYVHPDGPHSQRLAILVNGRPVREGQFDTLSVLACRFTSDALVPGAMLEIVLEHPDFARPRDSVASTDTRQLAFAFSNVRVFRTFETNTAAAEAGNRQRDSRALPDGHLLADEALLHRFISLGDNCELGVVQRHFKAEPMDLFRFCAISLSSLLHALHVGLHGIDAPELIEIHLRGFEPFREFIFCHSGYDLQSHTQVLEGQQPAHRVFVREQRRVSFLARMLLSDLKLGNRIMVVKRNCPMELSEVLPVFQALREYGPNTLLWIEEARARHAAGTVEVLANGLMKGYVRSLAAYDKADKCDAEAWLPTCRRAYELWRDTRGTVLSVAEAAS